jgi:two-component system NtrC family sensor kinase
MKLFYHLFGYILIGMIVLIGVDEYLSFQAEVEQFENDMIANAIQNGNSISGMIAHVWKESGEEKARQLIEDASRAGILRVHWVWIDTLSKQFDLISGGKEKLAELADGQAVSLKIRNNNGDLNQYTYVPVDIGQPDKGALELSQALVPLSQFTSRMLTRALIITTLLALICGLILYFFMDRKIRVPLNKLMKQAQRIGEGDLSADYSVDGSDELAEMAGTMNDMCSRLIIANEKIKFEYDARLRTLDQLRHTERLSTFGLLSADIAHELGTPLNVVDGRAKMIINEELDHEEIVGCATIIKNQAERMAVIIRQLLDFTRRPKQHFSLENLAFHIKQVFQLLDPMARRQRVSFSLSKPDEVVVLLNVDGSQIQQVLINLLMNSIQAMPNGGKVYVNLTNETFPASPCDGQDPEKYLKIRIVDEGEGIPPENFEHLFTPFFTTKTIGTGTGLGLSIAHGIVEEHGGWIDVESSVQNGACFSVYLPMKEHKA